MKLKPLVKSVLMPSRLTAVASVTDAVKVCGLLTKGISKTTRNKEEDKKDIFFRMLLGILGASSSGNLVSSKGTIRASEDTIRAGESTIRVGQDF